MCGRARLSSDVSEIKIAFGIPPERPTPNIAPSWNLAPTDPAPIVYFDAKVHTRMPAVLKPEAWPLWLGEQPTDAPQLKALLAPYPSEDMICWPVSPRVGNVKNNDPSLIEPLAAS